MSAPETIQTTTTGNGQTLNAAAAEPAILASTSSGAGDSETPLPSGCFLSFFEYETPKVVTVQNVPLGILRLLLQVAVVSFVVIYQLWYARGYQEFAEVEASVTTKLKGFSRSRLTQEALQRVPPDRQEMYERVWDESDYVVPPSENNAFFVMTNVVLTPNQTRTTCPEDPTELPEIICGRKKDANGTVEFLNDICEAGKVANLVKGHGETTGNCIESDRMADVWVCEITSWCPVEVDELPLRPADGPLIPGAETYTVFIKNSISFTRFGDDYHRNNMPMGICIYEPDDPASRQCPIFRLGDIVQLAGGNFTQLAVKGGVIGVYITWNCDLDWDFMSYCLPNYSFRILDTFGWNFRHAYYHEENRRTLVKSYGLKFLVVVDGRAAKFDLKNTVIVLVTGLGLLGLSTMFCDFILLNYSTDRRRVKEKKYETVGTTSQMLASTMRIMANTSTVSLQPFRNPLRSTSIFSALARRASSRANSEPDVVETVDEVKVTSRSMLNIPFMGQPKNSDQRTARRRSSPLSFPRVTEDTEENAAKQDKQQLQLNHTGSTNSIRYCIDAKPKDIIEATHPPVIGSAL